MPADLVLLALQRKLARGADILDADRVARLEKLARARKKNPPPEPIVPSELGDLTKADLLDLATEQDVEGRSTMTKAELIEALGGTV